LKKDQIILGIDPGTQLMGYALLRVTGNTPQVILIDALKLTGQKDIYVGRAQGVAIAAAMQTGLSVTEYAPKKVKQSITGNGNASKDQVWQMLQRTLQIEVKPQYFDATDALAVALCHYYQSSSPLAAAAGKGFKGWDDFIAKNPGKIKL